MLPEDSASVKHYWEGAFQPRVQFYKALVENTRGTTTTQDTLAVIENELQALQAQSAQFYRCINALRPVSRLSPELLSIIFHYLSILEPAVPAEPNVLEDRASRRSLTPTKRWVKVTHVCSKFRQCALGDRSLWHTTTTAFGPEWMNLLTERCQVPPRCVHVGPRAPMLAQLRALLQSAHTVQITSLHSSDSLSRSKITLLDVRSLSVYLPNRTRKHVWQTYEPVHHMPHLTDLQVHNVTGFEVASQYVSASLTSLYIGSDVEPVPLDAPDILDALARLSRLESLTLANCDLFADEDIRARSIAVPSLKFLFVRCETLVDVILLFDTLEFSPGVTVHLAGEAPIINGHLNHWTYLEHALSKPAWADLHTIELLGLPEDRPEMVRIPQHEDEGSLVFSAWREDEPAYVCITGQPTADRYAQLRLGSTQELRPKPNFNLQLTNYISERKLDKALGNLVSSFRTATYMRTLSVRRAGPLVQTKMPWLEILTQYPHVSAIRVDREEDLNHLLETLYFVQEPLLARELRTISIAPAALSSKSYYWNRELNWTHPTSKNKKKRGERGVLLASFLLQRSAAGAPLSSIYFDPEHLQSREMWSALDKGGRGHPNFVHEAKQVFKPMKLWNWEDWGSGF
ncbi:unnamed protein product [Peniophora sp. CBMAI 1063]|nr:unnamed protein product [Peniophora sp. CBMAI 1063]